MEVLSELVTPAISWIENLGGCIVLRMANLSLRAWQLRRVVLRVRLAEL